MLHSRSEHKKLRHFCLLVRTSLCRRLNRLALLGSQWASLSITLRATTSPVWWSMARFTLHTRQRKTGGGYHLLQLPRVTLQTARFSERIRHGK